MLVYEVQKNGKTIAGMKRIGSLRAAVNRILRLETAVRLDLETVPVLRNSVGVQNPILRQMVRTMEWRESQGLGLTIRMVGLSPPEDAYTICGWNVDTGTRRLVT